jgi:hypothetical protein
MSRISQLITVGTEVFTCGECEPHSASRFVLAEQASKRPIPQPKERKKDHRMMVSFLWLGNRGMLLGEKFVTVVPLSHN